MGDISYPPHPKTAPELWRPRALVHVPPSDTRMGLRLFARVHHH